MKNSKITFFFRVTVYNVSKLFPWNSELAKNYKLWNSEPSESCFINSKLAVKAGRHDLAKIWLICSKIAKAATSLQSLHSGALLFYTHPHQPKHFILRLLIQGSKSTQSFYSVNQINIC